MEVLGKIVLYIIMASCLAGAIASVVREDSGLGKAFHEGINTLGALFIPIIGITISVPLLSVGIQYLFGALFTTIGSDPAIAATTLIPSDVGGYLLASTLAKSNEVWIIAMIIGMMSAPMLAFSIPVGLSILEKKDQPFLALGAMSGIIAVPIGVFVSCLILMLTKTPIRPDVATTGQATYHLAFSFLGIIINMLPLILFCILLAIGLKLFPKFMIRVFTIYGKVLMSALTLIVAFAIVQHYTGIFPAWGFDSIIADNDNLFRAMELLGSIAMMLTGAFPMVYLIQKYLKYPLEKMGKLLGLSPQGSAGVLAASANALVMFKMVKDMPDKDKVSCIAFSVCGGYFLGDWIAFNVNFQPNLVVPIAVGQLTGGICGIIFSKFLVSKKLNELKNQK